MNKNFSQKCAIACQFIPFVNREDFREQFIYKSKEEELTKECKEFLQLCYNNEDKFYEDIENGKCPEELKKFKQMNADDIK